MKNVEIRHARENDEAFWLSLDKHISAEQFKRKARDKQGYVLSANGRAVGILRYDLFWDELPFCTLLFVSEEFRGYGYGKALIEFWEAEMQALGHTLLLTSTRSDESAQHFYRKLGYGDCGSLSVPRQPPELFLSKSV